MDRKDLRDIETSLGIQSPWTIKLLRYNDRNKCFDLAIESIDKKRKFPLLGNKASKVNNNDDLIVGRWRYANLGFYPCVIHAKVPKSISLEGVPISRDIISQPAYFGDPSRNYSNYIRQQVAITQIKGLDFAPLKSALGLSDAMIQQILGDIESTSLVGKQLAYLPTEIDPIWGKILNNQFSLKTQLLPLKFLLSRLTMIASKNPSAENLSKTRFELRKFFLDNYTQLESEIEQVCGINSTKLKQQSRSVKAKQRLVLPSSTNKVWAELLGGNINLHSNNMALNLLIFRQKTAFNRASDASEQQKAVESLRSYFKKNYRNLIKELVTQQCPAIHSLWRSGFATSGTQHLAAHIGRRILYAQRSHGLPFIVSQASGRGIHKTGSSYKTTGCAPYQGLYWSEQKNDASRSRRFNAANSRGVNHWYWSKK